MLENLQIAKITKKQKNRDNNLKKTNKQIKEKKY